MASTYLTRTFGSGNRRKWTYSVWFKLSGRGTGNNNALLVAGTSGQSEGTIKLSNDIISWSEYNVSTSAVIGQLATTQVFRDYSAWSHLVCVWDSGNSTVGNRMIMYLNGSRITEYSTDSSPSLNEDSQINNNSIVHNIGRQSWNSSGLFNGSMSHVHFSDGYALAPTAFGSTDSTTGEWEINIDPSVTYGNNGFWILKNGNSVTDQSGQGNNWTVGAGTLTKTEDSPSNVFATWNMLQATTAATYDFVSGNTRVAANDVAQFSLGATLAATTGKYYMEMIWVQHGGYDRWGMMPIDASVSNTPHITGIAWDESAANLYMLGNVVSGSWGSNMSTSDIIQIALDLDNGAFYLGVNGTWRNSGDPTSGASRTGAANFSATSLFGEDLTFAVGKGNAGTSSWNANFGNGYFETVPVSSAGTNASGNGIFEYDVPTGYTALSTKGLNS